MNARLDGWADARPETTTVPPALQTQAAASGTGCRPATRRCDLGHIPPRLTARNPASQGRGGRARRDRARARQTDGRRVLPLAPARPLPDPGPGPNPRRLPCLHSTRAGHAAFCRSSAARLRPQSPSARPSAALAPDLPRVLPARRGPALHRARQPASRVPLRAAPQLAPRRPRHGPGPAPPARRPCHLAPPRAGPAPRRPHPPGGLERLGWPARRRGGPEACGWAGPGPRAAAEGFGAGRGGAEGGGRVRGRAGGRFRAQGFLNVPLLAGRRSSRLGRQRGVGGRRGSRHRRALGPPLPPASRLPASRSPLPPASCPRPRLVPPACRGETASGKGPVASCGTARRRGLPQRPGRAGPGWGWGEAGSPGP